MQHCGYVTKIEGLRKHPNADRLQMVTFFGNDTIVSLEAYEGQLGIYFPTDLQLSEQYCSVNHLCSKTPDGQPDSGYMDVSKRNVKAIRLRGEKSDGLFMPIESLAFTGIDIASFNIGDTIDIVNGIEICRKYIPRSNHQNFNSASGNRTRKKKVDISPLFMEHADTEQLAYNLAAFHAGDYIEITLKMHGTSQRTARLPVFNGKYKRSFWDWLFRRQGTPRYEWGYVSGTRRTVLDSWEEGGFYGSNAFREPHAKSFEGKLSRGETVYYEVVGFAGNDTPIMASCKNSKLNDKEFTKQYGDVTTFSYGCEAPNSDFYVYRMTMTNEDGDAVEYTPSFMRYRCEQMGCKYVPLLWKGIIPDVEDPGDWILKKAEEFYDGPDPIGKTHVREGVVIRLVDRPHFSAYKHKNFSFKVLEGLLKESAEAPDMEEAQEIN